MSEEKHYFKLYMLGMDGNPTNTRPELISGSSIADAWNQNYGGHPDYMLNYHKEVECKDCVHCRAILDGEQAFADFMVKRMKIGSKAFTKQCTHKGYHTGHHVCDQHQDIMFALMGERPVFKLGWINVKNGGYHKADQVLGHDFIGPFSMKDLYAFDCASTDSPIWPFLSRCDFPKKVNDYTMIHTPSKGINTDVDAFIARMNLYAENSSGFNFPVIVRTVEYDKALECLEYNDGTL